MTEQPLVLTVSELSREEKEAVTKRMDKLRSVCGCTAGAVASLSALLLYVMFLLASSLGSGFGPATLGWIGVVVVVVAGTSGKVAAILIARFRLKRLVMNLSNRFEYGDPV